MNTQITMTQQNNYKDFGEIIPFAKKHLFETTLTTKSDIWNNDTIKNYNDPYRDFILTEFKSSIRNRPRNEKEEYEYITSLSLIVNTINTIDDNEKLIQLIYKLNGYSLTDRVVFHKSINISKLSYENYLNIKNQPKKKRKMPPRAKLIYLDEIIHTGSNYRDNENMDSNDLFNTFKFKGGQYGNYIHENERIELVNKAYDAFNDLARALDITPEKVSLDSTLSIAFGARGSGRASGHFEPELKVINLTKMKGAGVLAHEWGHALDNKIGNHFKALMGSDILYRIELQSFKDIFNYFKGSDFESNAYKLDSIERRRKAYWSTDVEMFARAFSAYIKDKLALLGIRNDYLVTNNIQKIEDKYNMDPQGQERKELFNLFEKLIADLKELKIL